MGGRKSLSDPGFSNDEVKPKALAFELFIIPTSHLGRGTSPTRLGPTDLLCVFGWHIGMHIMRLISKNAKQPDNIILVTFMDLTASWCN